MRKGIGCLLFFLLFGLTVYAKEEEPEPLYARSAILMDADSGRILFDKNGYEPMPMASTTKIMTCILALEQGEKEEIATASENAGKQPKVHLGVQKGEKFRMKDLLYSLMLESHNDSAVMIAEHLGGTVEDFANMMNRKAEELGCTDTHFITPNGLDAVDAGGKHATTAADLARIMRYCIMESPKKEEFLKITGTGEHTFTDVDGKRQFSCRNHNVFLSMMEGAISGKTGFTGEAGYCYVGALRREDRTFIVALLGCGWPNNRTYKWADTKKLMQYGIQNYYYKEIQTDMEITPVKVRNGIPVCGNLNSSSEVRVELKDEGKQTESILLREGEKIYIRKKIPKELEAPVRRGEQIGTVFCYLNGEVIRKYPVVAAGEVERITFRWCVEKIVHAYMSL